MRDSTLLVLAAAPFVRAHVTTYLRSKGLQVIEVAMRGSARTAEVVSLDHDAVSFAQSLGRTRTVPRLAGATLGRRGVVGKLAHALFPRVLVVAYARREPPAAWVDVGVEGLTGSVALAASPGGERGYVYRFSGRRNVPALVAKVALLEAGAPRIEHEAQRLRNVAETAAAAGAEVPSVLHTTRIGGAPVLLETFVRGTAAARVIAARPEAMEPITTALARWLTSWAAITAATTTLDAELVDAFSLGPLRAMAAELPSRFVALIGTQAESLIGQPVQTTAAHNDLTMWNVMVREDESIAVLDWENATSHALPLTDLFYAIVDAVAATDGYADRPAAFRSCFGQTGARAEWAGVLVNAQRRALGLDERLVATSFASCWLRHAHSERQRRLEYGFLALLNDLAAAPWEFWPLTGVVA